LLPSTDKDDTISRIVPALIEGSRIATSKNDVVSEFAIAHPDFSDGLRDAAKRMKLIQGKVCRCLI
jgi:acyl-CoA hydrolase